MADSGGWDVVSVTPMQNSAAGAGDGWTPIATTPITDQQAKLAAVRAQRQAAGQANVAGLSQGLLDVYRSVFDQPAAWLESKFGPITFGGRLPTAAATDVQDTALSQRFNQQMGNGIEPQAMRVVGNVVASAPLMGGAGRALGAVGGLVSQAVPKAAPAADFLAGRAGQSFVPQLMSRSANAALQGGGYGALTSSANDDSLGTNVARGAALAAPVPAASDALSAATGLVGLGVRRFADAFMPSQAPNIAGRILNRAGGPNVQFQSAPLPGMNITAGQATNSPGLLWLERSMGQMTPEARNAAEDAATANNGAIRAAIGQIGDLNSDASATMADRLDAANSAAKAQTQAAWKAANIDDATGVPTFWLQDRVNNYMGGLKVAERKSIDPDILSTLSDLGDNTTLGEVQAWRADLGDQVRSAYRAGQNNKARIVGGLADTVSDFLDEVPTLPGFMPDQSTMDAYNAARAATLNYKQTFNQPKQIRNVLGVDSYGADRVPPSAVAGQFIRAGIGAPEALNAYLKAVNGDPQALQAARDAFAQKFLGTVQTTAPDLSGARKISASAVTNFLGDYQHVINSPLFTPAQRNMIGSIGDAADMGARTARGVAPGGSDTAAKLAGKKFLDVLIGPGASKLMPLIGGIGGYAHSGPMGAAIGAVAGHGIESGIQKALFGAQRDRVLNVLQQAMSDPDMAKVLMQKASTGNASLISPAVRIKLLTALGIPGAIVGGQWSKGFVVPTFPPAANQTASGNYAQIGP